MNFWLAAAQQQSRVSLEPELVTYMDGLTTPLSAGQQTLLNTFVTDLKSGLGISLLSEVFDVMYILAGETQESSLRNLVRRAHDADNVDETTFTALEGFTGNGSSQYLELNYNARTQAVNYLLDSASYGIYFRSKDRSYHSYNGVYSTAADGGTSNSISISANNSTGLALGLNSGMDAVSNNDTEFMISLIRNTSASYDYYINKVKDSVGKTSSKIPNQGIVTLARRTTDGSVGLFNEDQQAFIFAGKGFSEAEQNIIYDTIQAYMTANGKQV